MDYWTPQFKRSFDAAMKKEYARFISMFNTLTINEDEETLEDFVKRVSPMTKLYIYNSGNGSFFSSEALNEIYKDLFFFEVLLPERGENSFNLEIKKVDLSMAGTDDLDGVKWKIQDCADHDLPIIRCGAVSCLMSEKFFPFQETMNRVLAMASVQQALKRSGTALLTCINGEMVHCL